MDYRRIISYILFALGVIIIIVALLGITALDTFFGIVLGLAALVLGIFFFRRSTSVS